MRPDDLGHVVEVGSPAVSPDGQQVAWALRRPDLDANRYRSSIWLAPADGSRPPRQVTAGVEGDGEPTWSPDGTLLAFTSRRGDDDDRKATLHVLPIDGPGEVVTLTSQPEAISQLRWSPDGTRLAFAGGVVRDFDLDQRNQVLVAEVGAGVPSSLPTVTAVTPDAPVAYHQLSWSPDGTRIAALEERTVDAPWNDRLTVVDVDTGEASHPAASLDRQHAPYPGARPPVWDGDDLLFNAEDAGATPVHRVPATGGEVTVVAAGTGGMLAQWDSRGGTLAATRTDPEALPEVVVVDADGTERALSRHTAAFHQRCPAHPTERFTVPSPVGDGDLDVWLVTPRDLDRSARHPVLLSIHGGPSTQYGERWFDEFQLWASAGYCVVFTNPHGSTGRDSGWLRTIRSPNAAVDPGNGWGGDDHLDVIAALDGALDRFAFLDPERMGVLGGSYGGYMTSWIVGHTDRFAAAMSERAVNDMLTLETTSDCMGLFGAMLGVDHLDDPDEYRRMSPITYVRDITTPVLILHSDEDWRCPVEQADKLYLALRKLGREVEYHRFPKEGHELSRSGTPKHRIRRAELIIEWFDRHLKP